MKTTLLAFTFAFSLLAARPAHAQGGCDDSPENPTVILAGLAGAAYAVSAVRTRLRSRLAVVAADSRK